MIEIVSAVLGLVGGFGQRYMEGKQKAEQAKLDLETLKEKNQFQLALQDKARELVILEAQSAANLADISARKETDVAAYGAMRASYEADKATYSQNVKPGPFMSAMLVAVDVVRGLTRPLITGYAMVLLTYLYATIPPTAPEFPFVIESIRAICATAITWWFAARSNLTGTQTGRNKEGF